MSQRGERGGGTGGEFDADGDEFDAMQSPLLALLLL